MIMSDPRRQVSPEMEKESIIPAKPLKDFKKKEVVYIPADFPSCCLGRLLKKRAVREKNMGFGYLYLLPDKVVLYQSIGAPLAALSLEMLIASGAKEIILLGFCGSLQPDYKISVASSISKALSEEGTSRHYLPGRRIFYPSLRLKKKIEALLKASKLPFLTGSVVSTDAPFRETKSWLAKMKEKGIDLVDMETSAVFALAEFYGLESAALMIVSDELWSGKWKKGFFDPQLEKRAKDYFLPFL